MSIPRLSEQNNAFLYPHFPKIINILFIILYNSFQQSHIKKQQKKKYKKEITHAHAIHKNMIILSYMFPFTHICLQLPRPKNILSILILDH